jgi:hypothetical protein
MNEKVSMNISSGGSQFKSSCSIQKLDLLTAMPVNVIWHILQSNMYVGFENWIFDYSWWFELKS